MNTSFNLKNSIEFDSQRDVRVNKNLTKWQTLQELIKEEITLNEKSKTRFTKFLKFQKSTK